ncbi:MAG: hypothetical protein IJ769_04000 [Clostridia bacterium]|nr:hypothetical protein [Clostridia bacterium]
MSFYSYKNANSDTCPGVVSGNILSGLNQRVCVQVKNIYDSCMQQEQLDDERIVIENIVPVLPGSDCQGTTRPCACDCKGNRCTCDCPPNSIPITHDEAVQNAENSFDPLPRPAGAWTFESCRSSTTAGRISNLSVERMTDRPQFARVRCTVDVPLDVLFLDQRCQEWMGQTVVKVDKDILLCIPDDSIIPFTLESLVSAICVSGSYIGNCAFDITVCVTVVLKVLAEVDILIPTYGFCQVPPCEEFAENVCDEFFSLPLFPQSSCALEQVSDASNGNGTVSGATGGCYSCGPVNPVRGAQLSQCSNCGTTCVSNNNLCPRCGSTMTTLN